MNKEKNTVIQLNIDNLGINGEGVGRWNGKTVFVKGALVGEKVKAKIIFSKPSFCLAILQERLTVSPERITPRCPLFLKCGGCNLQHLSYSAQLEYKRKLVADNLERIGKLSVKVDDTIASDKTFEYRNKMSLPVRKVGDKTVIGLFAQGSHRVVECNDCLLQPQWNKTILYPDKNNCQSDNGYNRNSHIFIGIAGNNSDREQDYSVPFDICSSFSVLKKIPVGQ